MVDAVSILPQGGGNVDDSVESEEVDGSVAEGGQVMGRRAMGHATVVFAKGCVADPMKTILDIPVLSPPGKKLPRIGTITRDAGDGVLNFDGLLAVAQRASSETADLCHAGPVAMFGQACCGLQSIMCFSTVPFGHLFRNIMRCGPLCFGMRGKNPPGIRRQSAL
jgi:hypothetical protein